METPVLIEPVPGNGYRAKGVEMFGLSAEGAMREEVLAKLREQLQQRLEQGAELRTLSVAEPSTVNP